MRGSDGYCGVDMIDGARSENAMAYVPGQHQLGDVTDVFFDVGAGAPAGLLLG
jgi:hypothetical protein